MNESTTKLREGLYFVKNEDELYMAASDARKHGAYGTGSYKVILENTPSYPCICLMNIELGSDMKMKVFVYSEHVDPDMVETICNHGIDLKVKLEKIGKLLNTRISL